MSASQSSIRKSEGYRFGSFEVSVAHNTLSRDGVPIRIQDLPFQMLLLLLEKEGEVASKEELRNRLWGDETFVEVDQNLYVIVAKLRDLLGDDAVSPRFIKTVSGRGYRFIGTVTRVGASTSSDFQESRIAEEDSVGDDFLTRVPLAVDEVRPADAGQSRPVAVEALAVARPRRARGREVVAPVLVAALLLVCAIGAYTYMSSRRRIYDPQQQILVGSFDNETRRSDFDQTLAFLVQLKLQESPYLTLISDQRLLQLRREPNFVSREAQLRACASLGGQLLLNSRLLPYSNGYRVQLMAFRCSDGKLLTTQQADADSEASLLTAVDMVTEKMRERLGEPEASLQRFNIPLTQSTTTSLAALKEFTEGEKKLKTGDSLAAVSDYKLAIDLDPRFALSYARLGTIYLNAQEPAAGAQYIQKAFDLRDRTTDKERLYITAHYYTDVAGDLQRSIETYLLWTTLYPRDWGPLNNLANLYDLIGRPDKGLEFARTAIRLNPDASIATTTLAQAYLEHGDYPLLTALCKDHAHQNNAFVEFHNICFLGAFAQGIEPDMQQELIWARGNPQESLLLGAAASAALYHGRMRDAEHLFAVARDNALANKLPEMAADIDLNEAIAAGEFGDSAQAIRQVRNALKLMPHDDDALAYAAIASALANSDDLARNVAESAVRQVPLNEVVNKLGLPTVNAIIALHKHHAAEAVKALEDARPLLLYGPMKFAPAYYLGMAYLENGQLKEATNSFQEILQHRAIAPDSIYIGLATLALGRTLHLRGDLGGATQAYDLASRIWGTAEVDFPPLKQLQQYRHDLSRIP